MGFVGADGATADFLAVQGGDGGLAFGGVRHFDEAESAAAVGIALHDDFGGADGAIGLESGAQVVVAGLERKISNVDFHVLMYS